MTWGSYGGELKSPQFITTLLIMCIRSNANSVPAAGWFLYEILRDPALELNIRAEVASAALPRTSLAAFPLFDIAKLCSGPRLQSIYAETLRLRVAILVSRRVQVPQFQLCGWLFKKNESLAAASSTEARDEEVWSQGGEGNPHPLGEFWAERFLVFPENPASGPLKRPKTPRVVPTKNDGQNQNSEPIFSMDGLATAWIPYSGGPRLCPGRHFAKQEMISASAILLSAYDMELTEPWKRIGVNKSYYGFGTMPPKDKIGVRIRRKAPGSRL
jgi:cytochrome P450